MTEHFALRFAPLVDPVWLWLAAGLGLSLLLFALRRRAPGALWRAMALALLLTALANPVAEHALTRPVKDTVLLAIDDSASTGLANRRTQIAAALPKLRDLLRRFDDLDVREVHVTGRDATNLGTALLAEAAMAPSDRRAGVMVLTDGQAHDLDGLMPQLRQLGPIHTLLAGQRGERDRRIEIVAAPHYGLVGQHVTMKFRVVDQPAGGTADTIVDFGELNGVTQRMEIRSGTTASIDLPLTHAGDNIFTLATPVPPGDVAPANNRAVVKVTGVREKLRVLLVSGEPHPGERAWRNLLKADPAVELVHFTILRPPQKQDATPINQLALIAFPVRELFEEKLHGFDLIVFDRFRKQGLLPMAYLDNIARYVEDGGAFLDVSGPSYVTPQSLYKTPLARILPTAPRNNLIAQPFQPTPTETGANHPVTMELGDPARWGHWYRQTETTALHGEILLTGAGGLPLLVIDRVGKGRVAQLASDQTWLWQHGHDGGGPYAELTRRLAHWLMQEPDLEEGLLRLSATETGTGYDLSILRPGMLPPDDTVTVTAPDGTAQDVILKPEPDKHRAAATVAVTQPGIYTVRHGSRDQIITAGDPNAKELQDMHATDIVLKPLADATGGGIFWLADHPDGVDLRRTGRFASTHGDTWLGLPRTGATVTLGTRANDLLPSWLWVALIAATIMMGWRKEGT